ncbi:MAG: RDD family protein [Ferruginibacter sp.]|nr:RDD family protein [Ferruginibacter sp.]
MNSSLSIKRVKAFIIDYLIILIYIGLLFGVTLFVFFLLKIKPAHISPVTGEMIGFLSLTVPVVLYFSILENGKYLGTIGKRKMGLCVVSNKMSKPGFGQILFRNIIKFLPWELAHFFIYRLFYFDSVNKPVPGWVLAGLIIAQVIALVYLFCMLIHRNKQGIYELLSQTRVIANDSPENDFPFPTFTGSK